MTTPNLKPRLAGFWHAWNGGAPITDLAEKHRFTEAFAKHAAATDPRWGRKSRAGTAPISKDTIAYWKGPIVPGVPTDGVVDARDIIRSSGQIQWHGEGSPDYDNITARWFPVSSVPDPVPDPDPDPDPDPTPAPPELLQVAAALTDIAAAIRELAHVLEQGNGIALEQGGELLEKGLLVRARVG